MDKFSEGGECYHKEACTINFEEIYPTYNFDPETGDGNCEDVSAHFFIQYTCMQDQETQAAKYDTIAKATAIIMFVSFSYMLFIWYLQKSQGIDRLENDMNTITASDFTVELEINREMWEYFQEQHYKPKG